MQIPLSDKQRSMIIAIVLVAVLLSSAYLAAGMLHDRLVPEVEEPVASVSIVQVDTGGLGGTGEHPPFSSPVVNGADYDLGLKMIGLREAEGVRVMFSLTRTAISVEDVEAYYYDVISHTWRSLSFNDSGDTLVAMLGNAGGANVYEGSEQVSLIILFFNFDGRCDARCWVDLA